MCKLYPNIRPYRKISFVTSIRNAIYRTKTMQIHKVESFTRKPWSAKQRHAREWKCYPSVCPKQPSGHQPTGLWSDRFQGKREVVRPRFFAAFLARQKIRVKVSHEMDGFVHGTTSHEKLLGNRETPKMQRLCHRNTITDNCASSLKPAASPRTSSGLPELIFISSLFLVVSIFCMMLLPLVSLFSCTSHLENMYLLPP